MSFEKLEYQERAIENIRAAMRKGSKAPLLVAPTGAGKTFMGASCAAMHIQRSENNSVSWFAHRTELVDQAAKTFVDLGIPVGVRGASPRARVQIGMVQTALARGQIPEATLSILDEAHHYVSDEWKRVPEEYKKRNVVLLGLTATPERADGTGLVEVFDSLTVAAQTGELIALGRLSPFECYAPKSAVQSARLALLPVDAYCKHSPGRSAVVFAPNIINAEEFATQFREKGITSEVVHGKLSDDERAARLARFDSGEMSVVVNVGVLTEGWDSPRAKVAIFARKVGSTSLYLQMVGRVLRLWKGETAQVIDLTGVVALHGPPDEEREYFLEGEAVRRKGASAGVTFCRTCHSEKPMGAQCPVCGTEAAETEILKSQGIDLQKFEGMRKLNASGRAERLANWYRSCKEKGHKMKSADYKYKAVFGQWPPGDVKAAAERMVG